jgi:hypothetical protein
MKAFSCRVESVALGKQKSCKEADEFSFCWRYLGLRALSISINESKSWSFVADFALFS